MLFYQNMFTSFPYYALSFIKKDPTNYFLFKVKFFRIFNVLYLVQKCSIFFEYVIAVV